MTIAVDWDVKQQKKQKKNNYFYMLVSTVTLDCYVRVLQYLKNINLYDKLTIGTGLFRGQICGAELDRGRVG